MGSCASLLGTTPIREVGLTNMIEGLTEYIGFLVISAAVLLIAKAARELNAIMLDHAQMKHNDELSEKD